jgi:PRTRC genetic system protein C
MTITVQKLQRSFAYNGIALPDPGSELSPEQVRDVYSATYPEITTASIEGPEQKGERLDLYLPACSRNQGQLSANSPRTSRVVVRRRDDGLSYVEPQSVGISPVDHLNIALRTMGQVVRSAGLPVSSARSRPWCRSRNGCKPLPMATSRTLKRGIPTGIPAFDHEEMKRCVQALQRLVQRSQATVAPGDRCQVAASVQALIL